MGQEVKNVVRAQSKYGLMGSSAKTGKKIFRGSQEQFLDKTVIWDRTPPSYTSNAVYMCGEGSRVPNLQTELNYLYLFKSYCIFSDLFSPGPRVIPVVFQAVQVETTWSPSSPCHPRRPPWSPLSP